MKKLSFVFIGLLLPLVGCLEKPVSINEPVDANDRKSEQGTASNRLLGSKDEEELGRLRAELSQIKAALNQQTRLAEISRQYYWSSLMGRSIGSVEIGGAVYEDARIDRITQSHVSIRHRVGLGSFPISALPVQMQKQLLLVLPDELNEQVVEIAVTDAKQAAETEVPSDVRSTSAIPSDRVESAVVDPGKEEARIRMVEAEIRKLKAQEAQYKTEIDAQEAFKANQIAAYDGEDDRANYARSMGRTAIVTSSAQRRVAINAFDQKILEIRRMLNLNEERIKELESQLR